VPALVEHFQLEDDTPLSAQVDHVLATLWSSIFVTREYSPPCTVGVHLTRVKQDVGACSWLVGVTRDHATK
jgi:hypothetical protein